MNIRTGINGNERFSFEPNKNRAEHLYEAWDRGFWETLDAARRHAAAQVARPDVRGAAIPPSQPPNWLSQGG
jgi:hypothetical protein